MKAEDWYIDIFIARIVDGWGKCDWELSVDDLRCDMNCMDGHDQWNKM